MIGGGLKISLIMVNHQMFDDHGDNSIEQIVNINRSVPILIDTGYRKPEMRELLSDKLKQYRSVIIKPVILQNLTKTIKGLTSGNV